jgi:outer membrane protein, heavy metal efflux system
MPTRAQVSAWIAGFALAVPSLAAAQDRTEREILDLVIRDGPQARAIRAETEIVRREQLARLAYPNPEVTYSREGAGFTEFLQVGQALPGFGTRGVLSRAGVAASATAEAERDARLWMLRADAAVAIARLSAEQARQDVAEAHAREIARLIDVLRIREREGEGSRFDRLRAEQELQDARLLVTSAAIAVAEARTVVVALLPRNVGLTRVSGIRYTPQTPAPTDTLVARAASTRAELRALQRSAERAAFEADAARRARLPAPILFGGLKRADTESGRDRGGVFGVSLSLPLFDAGGREAARWAAERARADAEYVSVEQQIRMEILRASEALALHQAAVAADEEGSADELTRIAEVAYREGDVGILELLDAARTVSRARIRSIDVRLDARLAQIALERAVGDVLWP